MGSFGRKSDGKFRGPVDSATVITKGDLLYWDTDDLKPASSQTDQLSEGDNQGLFASLFAGVAELASADGDTLEMLVDANPLREFELTCVSETHEVGDLLGANEAAGGTALEDQEVVKVTGVDAALAVVTRRNAAAATTVFCRLIRGGALTERTRAKSNTETLGADRVLTLADAKIQVLDPGGAGRNVDLPIAAASAGASYMIANSADAAEILTVRLSVTDGGATVVTPTQAESAIVWSDGSSWYGVAAANS